MLSEMGHIRVVRLDSDRWPGACVFHGDCVEGLASDSAVEARVGMTADLIATNHLAWRVAAHALGQILHNLVLATAPQRIILGGGVMTFQPHLLSRVRHELQRSLNGYVEAEELTTDIERYIATPDPGTQVGPPGALKLASSVLP